MSFFKILAAVLRVGMNYSIYEATSHVHVKAHYGNGCFQLSVEARV